MNENDELLDLVDVNDHIVGTITRGEMVKAGYNSPKGFVRFAVGFLINDKNEIWVPIRGLHKSIAPGGCDFSVAEHVVSGESYSQAIERAFKEEAGMDVAVTDLVSLGKLMPDDVKSSYEEVFALFTRSGKDPMYSREEFTSASWMSIDAFEDLLVSGPATKSALLPAFRLLQQWRTRNDK